MKKLLTGNEAVALGAWEAGCHFASAYPGTPSTEIMENISTYKEIKCEWAPNEKVAVESCCGASLAGARTIASMKHVGMNVAADPMFTFAYMGVNGGFVIITADEPGQHSSQNEQDNRYYAKMAKVPLLEPSDSQECLDMVKMAFEISEKYDTLVIVRLTTRVCHSKGIVDAGERKEVPIKEYKKDVTRTITVPALSRPMRIKVEKRMGELKKFSETVSLNRIENDGKNTGVISSGMCYYYAKEVFKDEASCLKLGFTNPMPEGLISKFCEGKEKIYVVEENDPYIKDTVKALGFKIEDVFPFCGEMTPDVLRKSLGYEELSSPSVDEEKVLPRPPMLCAGCPHRGFFYEIGKRKDLIISGDIGCYTLGFAQPYNAMDVNICMGASISAGHGAQQVLDMVEGNKKRVVAVIGDSTFFHTGINSLINVVYNKSNTISVILDNRITGMTGHQQNPGSGYTIKGEETVAINIEGLCRAIGIRHIFVVNPNHLDEMNKAIDDALAIKDEPSVIITRYPCVLKQMSLMDKEEFPKAFKDKYTVSDSCIGCKKCLTAGCPAISFDLETRKSVINRDMCVGCSVCSQICPVKAIVKEEI